MKLDESILRKWDIRGRYPENINEDVAEALGYAYAKLLKRKNKEYCIVGRDNRIGGESLANNLMYGLTKSGINVIYLDIVTTPMLNFACKKFNYGYGIMITASHNPKDENGFKLFGEHALHLPQDELKEVYEYIKADERNDAQTSGWIKKLDISDNYKNDLLKDFNFSKRLKLVIDCGNGTASTIIRKVYESLNCDVTYLYCDSDPTFPNHHPDPNIASNLTALVDKVLEIKADLGIAYDGDCDRVGIVDNEGNIIDTDKLMAIFSRDILKTAENKNIVLDVKCSMVLEEDIKLNGGNPVMVPNGGAYIERYVYEHPTLFGGEYSGHVFFTDRHYGYDDGIYAGLRMQELICKTDKKCSELTEGLMKVFNTPEIKVKIADEVKFEAVNKVKNYCIEKNYNFIDIDGVRVKYPDGWALIRASNTGPNITMRFEATTRPRLEEILKEFTEVVESIIKK